jgi:hypothetical protein
LKTFDEYAGSLKPIPHHAQILIQLEGEATTLERVLEVLRTTGVEMIRYQMVREEWPRWIIVVLASGDMRQAVLKLSEAGFLKTRGINAKSS